MLVLHDFFQVVKKFFNSIKAKNYKKKSIKKNRKKIFTQIILNMTKKTGEIKNKII